MTTLFQIVLTINSYNRAPAKPDTRIARAGFSGKKLDEVRGSAKSILLYLYLLPLPHAMRQQIITKS